MSTLTEPNACPEFADRLVDLSDGELPDDERLLVTTHVANCAACREQLRRLDASLTMLRTGIVSPSPVAIPRRTRAGLALAAVGTAAALLIAVAISFKAPTSGRGEQPVTASAGNKPATSNVQSPNTLTTGQGFEGRQGFTHEAALRRIALLEQQARLQMSLDLMPQDAWYAEARAANESVLAVLRQATEKGSGVFGGNPSSSIQ